MEIMGLCVQLESILLQTNVYFYSPIVLNPSTCFVLYVGERGDGRRKEGVV